MLICVSFVTRSLAIDQVFVQGEKGERDAGSSGCLAGTASFLTSCDSKVFWAMPSILMLCSHQTQS